MGGVLGVVGGKAGEALVVGWGLGVDQVSQEDQPGFPKAEGLGGAEGGVCQPLGLEDPPEGGEVGVEVPDGDDPHPLRRALSSP